MKQLAIICAFTLSGISVAAQSIQNLSAQFVDGKVIVAYDVVGAKPNQHYSLELFGSHNNYAAPLQNVTGDVGKSVLAGAGKKITWNAAAELGTFTGQITFKVKGEMIPVPFSFQSPLQRSSARRGKNFQIKWDGGVANQTVHLDLYDGSGRVLSLGDLRNIGEYTWNIPKNFPKGKYSIQLTAGAQAVRSGDLSIKSRVPLFLKVIPILAIGGVAAALGGGSGGGGGGNPTNPNLPAAPDPD
jgi:hypothetical protein